MNLRPQNSQKYQSNAGECPEIAPEEIEQFLARNEEVRRCVYAAFPDLPCPGDEAIGDIGRLSDHLYAFAGQSWRQIPPRSIADESHFLAVWFMNDEGFRYFLPVFILACLDTGLTSSMETITPVFVPPCCNGGRDGWPKFRARFEGLPAEQCQCISMYLDYYYAENPPRTSDALTCVKSYWANPHFPAQSDD